jgi:mono/diheme cytochrome c family protein
MKRNVVIAVMVLSIGIPAALPLRAACRGKNVVTASEEVKVVVPFAVPVGVPVATFAPYFYSYQQFQMKTPESTPALPATPTPPASSNLAAAAASVVFSRCASCHGGATPKAELSLEHVDRLTAAQRVKAIHEVVVGNMPRGGKLSGDEMRAVVNELAAASRSSN